MLQSTLHEAVPLLTINGKFIDIGWLVRKQHMVIWGRCKSHLFLKWQHLSIPSHSLHHKGKKHMTSLAVVWDLTIKICVVRGLSWVFISKLPSPYLVFKIRLLLFFLQASWTLPASPGMGRRAESDLVLWYRLVHNLVRQVWGNACNKESLCQDSFLS